MWSSSDSQEATYTELLKYQNRSSFFSGFYLKVCGVIHTCSLVIRLVLGYCSKNDEPMSKYEAVVSLRLICSALSNLVQILKI